MKRWLLLASALLLSACASSGYRYQSDGYWTAPAPRYSAHLGYSACGYYGYSPFAWHPCFALGPRWYSPYASSWYYAHPATQSSSRQRAADRARAMMADRDDWAHDRWQRYDDLAPSRRRFDGIGAGAGYAPRSQDGGRFERSFPSERPGSARGAVRSMTEREAIE
jgi:hypothetical protein